MRILVVLSGGMDSTVLLHHLNAQGHKVSALSVDYGQRHRVELDCAEFQAVAAGADWDIADLSTLGRLLPGSSQTDLSVPVPKGHYAQETMKATVVPNRNMILLSVAIARALATKCDAIAYAAHSGDHAIYPDCREEFAAAMATAASLCDWEPIQLLRPFIHMTKADIVSEGARLGVNFARTWSCYEGLEEHCGACGTCIERREAFYLAGVTDPTRYAVTAPSVEQLAANGWKLNG